jgi:cysteine desulfurase
MIYLDYNASTPVDPQVFEAMRPYLTDAFGNPSSSHPPGRRLREALETARAQVAGLIGARSEEIIFTSGGTEGCNHVIKGVAHHLRDRGRHLITSTIEHPAVHRPCEYLEGMGYQVSRVGVDSRGRIDPQDIAGEVRGTTILISIMHANNEVGTIQDVAEMARIAREGEVLIHTDAAQSCGKIPTNVQELGVDFLTIAGHKLYAPQGIGALYVRSGVTLEPFVHGAGHQEGRRAGTEPVALIVGLGKACEKAAAHRAGSGERTLRERLWQGLRARLGERAVRLGDPDGGLPNTLCVGFRGRIGGELLERCPRICASTGAACHTGRRERSATLAAMDVPEDVAFGAIRFSVGRLTTPRDVDEAVEELAKAVLT